MSQTINDIKDIRKFVADPETNGGLAVLQDCGVDMLKYLLNQIDCLEAYIRITKEAEKWETDHARDT